MTLTGSLGINGTVIRVEKSCEGLGGGARGGRPGGIWREEHNKELKIDT